MASAESHGLAEEVTMAWLRSRRVILLTPEERDELLQVSRSTKEKAGRARRARIVLLAAGGTRLREISRQVGVDRKVVRKWLDRFRKRRLKGLDDLPRPGRKPVFSPQSRHGVGSHRLSATR